MFWCLSAPVVVLLGPSAAMDGIFAERNFIAFAKAECRVPKTPIGVASN